MAQMLQAFQQMSAGTAAAASIPDPDPIADTLAQLAKANAAKAAAVASSGSRLRNRHGKAAYKRVDQIWDTNIHDYRLQETAKEQVDAFDGYVFHVRRRFDWENKYRNTQVDIKSKFLRDALQEVMKDVRAVSLVENEPSVDPNMLFLHLEEMRAFYKKTLKERIKKAKKNKKKKKLRKRAETMREHLKLMVSYLDKDFEATKKTLVPMLKAGNITFEYIWALFKPNSIAYTTTYGASEHPRCFKVDQAYREKTFTRGEFYVVEGRYLEYDGKNFGLGDFEVSIDAFKGPKKITSLAVYPLEYHKDPTALREQLIERGKKFVSLAGMNFKFMTGLAFQKKKRNILKFNINGRVMIDPKTFRRENANYQVSTVRNADDKDDDSDSDSCNCSDEEDNDRDMGLSDNESDGGNKTIKYRLVRDENNKTQIVEVNSDDENEVIHEEHLDKLPNGDTVDALSKKREFDEEELLISSSIVLGFSFVEKSWFEFSVAGIGEIVWNDTAFDSLVLDPNHKSIVKAQVCSHKFHSGETIDDVIQGKGKGLVFVLHGPPGVGKTLTAEGIAEFLRCPLYAVSAGDLGTDARIEHELNKIMAIAHSWGAVLLLDEADVFLEKRQHQDVHRNALVSVFLRLLEYFQGILFLTTNRVETFDEAFQSRIHIALKYNELGTKAKKEIWRMFLDKVTESGSQVSAFKESDYDRLAKSNLNGRQIKNMVKTAQALAVFEKNPLNMEHIRRVLDVSESFERDLKGGTGYDDAMRSYT
ncbi:P-loop containing nucleoside triphosphate hydrolase protein [Microthyrium microscopicum]|uniref:P-loop containing nucleoside triphosphate hydrolase protein n=1 Tax=Microthyrium microscopicum TaxID=703497 RepID=A0A6A6U4F2_9PEZI|nr:P-loop containing nucleoside triphosphate hydrolase protein [Microthyrium microscopicum]